MNVISFARLYEKLQIGLGYTTNAYVYGNFSINMKDMPKSTAEKHTRIHEFV